MTDFIKRIKGIFADKLFTTKCPYCSRVIDRNEYACNKCKAKFPDNIKINYAVGGYACYSAFPYSDIFKRGVCAFKFKNCGAYSKPLAYALYKRTESIIDLNSIDLITSVPMHKKSLKNRGYNQSQLLAKDFAELVNIPYADTLEQHKENKTQHNLKKKERAKNVKGVYRIIDKSIVENKRILIIDDIITTGNTLGECARTLTKAGSGLITCATICAAGFE